MTSYLIPAMPLLAFAIIYLTSLSLAVRSLRAQVKHSITIREAVLLVVWDGVLSNLKTTLERSAEVARLDLRYFLLVGVMVAFGVVYLSHSAIAKLLLASLHVSSLLTLLVLWWRWRKSFTFRQLTVLLFYRYDRARFGVLGRDGELGKLAPELHAGSAMIALAVGLALIIVILSSR